MKYNLSSINKHIQTEGGLMGTVSTFLIFAESKVAAEKAYSILEILKTCDINGCAHVVLTGHRPAEKKIDGLIEALVAGGYTVQLETCGTVDIKARLIGFIKEKLFITCTPIEENEFKYFYADELKYNVTEAFPLEAIDKEFNGRIYLKPDCNRAEMIQKVIKIIGRNNQWKLCISNGNRYGWN